MGRKYRQIEDVGSEKQPYELRKMRRVAKDYEERKRIEREKELRQKRRQRR